MARNLTKVARNVLLALSDFYGKTKFEVKVLDMCGQVWKNTVLALNNRAFPRVKNSAVCTDFPMGSKSRFGRKSDWENS